MIKVLENEINGFSKWFRWAFYALFFVYLGVWLFTIHLANIQKQNSLEPVLPIMPKDSEEYKELTESIIDNFEFANGGKYGTCAWILCLCRSSKNPRAIILCSYFLSGSACFHGGIPGAENWSIFFFEECGRDCCNYDFA